MKIEEGAQAEAGGILCAFFRNGEKRLLRVWMMKTGKGIRKGGVMV